MDKYTGTGSTPYYFHTNAIGSVTAITDGNGNLVERVSYDVFGMPTFTDAAGEVVSKSTIGNTLLFHGRRYDPETNLYYYRARYYDPIMGRFLQIDPMGYRDGWVGKDSIQPLSMLKLVLTKSPQITSYLCFPLT